MYSFFSFTLYYYVFPQRFGGSALTDLPELVLQTQRKQTFFSPFALVGSLAAAVASAAEVLASTAKTSKAAATANIPTTPSQQQPKSSNRLASLTAK